MGISVLSVYLRLVSVQYYITKENKTVGPCSIDDLRAYLAYGSINLSDLIRRDGEKEWLPVASIPEIAQASQDETARDITTRRRVARYRSYEKVPPSQQAGVVLKRLLIGFFFFPPLLWRTAGAVFQDKVFRSSPDKSGFLRTWPRWLEGVITAILIINAVVWGVAILWLLNISTPFLDAVGESLGIAAESLSEWLKGIP